MRILTAAALFALCLFADPLTPGSSLGSYTLRDQFDTPHRFSRENYTRIVVAQSREDALKVVEFLQRQPKDFLSTHHCAFVSDIHSMPTLVTKLFALPKMKKYPFAVLLIYEKEHNIFPMREGKLTFITLQNNTLLKVSFGDEIARFFR